MRLTPEERERRRLEKIMQAKPKKLLRVNDLKDATALALIDGLGEIVRSETDFRDYQTWMSDLMLKLPAVFVAAGMGLGKTGAALWAARRALDEGVVRRVLVIAPLNVANYTWPEAMHEWDFCHALTYSVLTGAPEDRDRAVGEDTQIHIINRENLVWLVRHWGRHWPYDMLIYDEASRLKGAKKKTKGVARKNGTVSAKKLNEFGALARVRMYFKRVALLSGTPAPNGLIDLWGPLYIIDKGARLGTSMTAYKRRWFREDHRSFKIEPFDHSEREIMGAIEDVFVTLREEDYLTLPPLIPIERYVNMPSKLMQEYRRFERTMVSEEYDVEAVSAGVLTNKLLQFANGSLYKDDQTAVHLHDAKLDELESIVAEAMGEPVLCAYSFKFDVERIKRRFPKWRIFGESKSDLRDWNAGKLPGMIVHPASAGHGLNFQHGGHIAVWYGLNWSLELYQQFLKRLHRSGQKADKVFLYHILTRGTEDQRLLRMLAQKDMTQDRITESTRVRYKQIRQRHLLAA